MSRKNPTKSVYRRNKAPPQRRGLPKGDKTQGEITMEKIYYELCGTEFSTKAIKWFAALNRAAGSTARYYEKNSDQWGRAFGHHGYIVANSKTDIDVGLKILEESGRFERIPGDPTTLARWIVPSRGKTPFSFNMRKQDLANQVKKKLNLSDRQWSDLANGKPVFIGEQLLLNQSWFYGNTPNGDGPHKCVVFLSSWPSLRLVLARADGEGFNDDTVQKRWGIK
jgi:hypothetical protein